MCCFPYIATLFIKRQNNCLSRSNSSRPHNTCIIMHLFNNSSHCTRNTNTVATHNKRLLFSLLVHKCCVHTLGIFHAKLKYLRHFNAASAFKLASTTRTHITSFYFAYRTPRIDVKIDTMTCTNTVVPIAVSSYYPSLNIPQRFIGKNTHAIRQANRANRTFWQAKFLKLRIVHKRKSWHKMLSFNIIQLMIAWNKKCNRIAIFICSNKRFYTFARRCMQKLC